MKLFHHLGQRLLCLVRPLGFAALCVFWAGAATVASGSEPPDLTLPIYDPARGLSAVPAYDAHKFVIQLAPIEVDRLQGNLLSIQRTGLAGLDEALDRQQVERIERQFLSSTRPLPGEPGIDLTGYFVVHLREGQDLASALEAFAGLREVISVEPVGIFPVLLVPNDSLASAQYWIDQANGLDSHLTEAWDLVQGDSSIILAIVDTGVLWDHPDLGGPQPFTGGNIWTNWGEFGGSAGMDDDGNGFIDDFRGWDFVDGKSGDPNEDLNVPDNDPRDWVGHGTHVAGMAGAITNNVSGVAGAGRNLKIMAIRAGWDDNRSLGGVVDMSFCAQSIEYARQNGAKVINCSWLNGNLGGLGAAVDNAIANGVVIVVAAGNANNQDRSLNYLATRGDCIDVAALDSNDLKASFSSYGTWVDVSGAGQSTFSTYASNFQPTYRINSGTSFSAPLVAGIVGLYQSYRMEQGLPLATPQEILFRLRDTSDPVDDLNPTYAGKLGGGRVNALRMIQDPPTSLVTQAGGQIRVSPVFVDWDGTGNQTIVFGTTANTLVAISPITGEPRPGWPVATSGAILGDPAVYDIDNDGVDEVIVATADGVVHALNSNGTAASGWPLTTGAQISNGPALANLDDSPGLEVVFASNNPSQIHVVSSSGSYLPGWPRDLPQTILTRPALADLDNDGRAEIIFGSNDSTVAVWNVDGTSVAGWPVRASAALTTAPAIGDLDQDDALDVVIGSADAQVYAWNAQGKSLPGWPVFAGSSMLSYPALADIDGDDRLEVIVGNQNSFVYAWHDDGSVVTGWPYRALQPVQGDPAAGDVNGDGKIEVVVGSRDGMVHAIDGDGFALAGWPRQTGDSVDGGPTLGDPDRDGQLEVAVGSEDSKFYLWDFGPGSFDPDQLPWFTSGRSFLRQGSTVVQGVTGEPPVPVPGLSMVVDPNPTVTNSIVWFRRGQNSSDHVDFMLYDNAGRLITRESVPFDGTGTASWTLLPRTGDGVLLSAGVYFIRGESGGDRRHAKWVFLR